MQSVETAQLEELLENIQQLQQIMIDVATGKSRIQDEEEDYTELYQEVELNIEILQDDGLAISNPNNFSSLWDWCRHWKSQLDEAPSRRKYVYDRYTDIIDQIETALHKHRITASPEEIVHELEPTRLERLITKIQQLQEIMIAVATGESEIEEEEERYVELYQEITSQIRNLQSAELPILNKNHFRSLWHWHSYWSLQLDGIPSRREYILQVYSNVIEPIKKALNRHRLKGTSSEELVQNLKRYLNQQTSTQPPASKIPVEFSLRGNATTMSAEVPQPKPIHNRWAMLVGVNRYIDVVSFPRLNFCVNDVLVLEQTLKELDYIVVCLHDQLDRDSPRFPTRDNVEAELTRLCETVEPDDLLLVHFACHGKLIDGQPVLITHETRATTMAKKALRLAEVKQQMQQSRARRQVVTLDACHTGVEVGRDVTDPEFIRNSYELAEGFAMICASTAQQIAQEWREKEHGVFTYYLLEGLSGKADRSKKGFVTVDDLKTHVLHNLRRWYVEQGGAIQEPTAQTEGLGDMILADYRDRSQGDLL
jgi:hypothetical protein